MLLNNGETLLLAFFSILTIAIIRATIINTKQAIIRHPGSKMPVNISVSFSLVSLVDLLTILTVNQSSEMRIE